MTTSLFADSKFGTFKFGPTILDRTRFGLEVDWDDDGYFDGQNEGSNLQDLSIVRGRRYLISANGEEFEPEDTGRFSCVLLDENRLYDPYNSSSPLYGNLRAGKYFRVVAGTPTGARYPLMAGMLDDPVNYIDGNVTKARFEGTDGWSLLRNQSNEVTLPLQENIYIDQAISLVLDAAGWPRIWGANLDVGIDQQPYFWVDTRSAAKVIHDLVHNELGNVNIAADGKMRYRSRLSLEEDTLTLTDADVRINTMRRMSPAEVIRNVIKVQSAPRTEEVTQAVWSISSRLRILAGETISSIYADFRYGGVVVPVKNPITPVAVTDYDATANENGTGANYTANIAVGMEPFGTRAKLTITNSGANTAWVRVQVRGTPLSSSSSVSFSYEDDASIRQFGRKPFALAIDQDVNTTRLYLDLLKLYMMQAKDFLTMELVPNPDVQFSLDLGQIIRGEFSSMGISRSYRVIRVAHKWNDKAGMTTRTSLWLEPYIRLFAGVQVPFQIPAQLGGS